MRWATIMLQCWSQGFTVTHSRSSRDFEDSWWRVRSNGNYHVCDLNLVTIFWCLCQNGPNRQEHLLVVTNSFRLKHRCNGSGQNDRWFLVKVRERCGVRGVKVDKNHCVLPGCECNEEKDSYIVNGDILVQSKGMGLHKKNFKWKTQAWIKKWFKQFKIRNKLAEYMDHRYYGLAVSFHIGQGLKVRLIGGNFWKVFTLTLSSEPWKRKTNYPYTSDWFIIDEGVRALERWTCLRFVEHTNERDYVGNASTFL